MTGHSVIQMSEKLSPYEFAQLLVDVATSTYNNQIDLARGAEFKSEPLDKLFVVDKIDTYDISTEDTILFNEETEHDTIEINFTVGGEPVSYKLKNISWPFNGEKNE